MLPLPTDHERMKSQGQSKVTRRSRATPAAMVDVTLCETARERHDLHHHIVGCRRRPVVRTGWCALLVSQRVLLRKGLRAGRKGHLVVPIGGGLPQLVVTSAIGTAIVPHDFPVRESKDGRMHVCIQDVWVVCLFVPPRV